MPLSAVGSPPMKPKMGVLLVTASTRQVYGCLLVSENEMRHWCKKCVAF